MKKTVQIIIFVFVFLSTMYCVLRTSYAQEFNSEKAYSDYVFIRSNYDTAYRNYEIAKEAYLKNDTLTLKEEARIATLEMLRSRDDLHRVYLTAIRTKVSETKGLTNDEQGGSFSRLDSEVLYYQGHKLTYTGSETLEELFKINKDVEEHYTKTTLPYIYESLFLISYGQQVGIRQDHQAIYQTLVDFLNQKIADGVLIIDPFNRWILDITGLTEELQKNENFAKVQIQKIYTEKYNAAGTFDKAVNILSQSISNLLRLNNFTAEFLIAIDNQI